MPYRGGGPLMNDAVAGHVPLSIGSVFVTKPHIDAGRLRLIAVGTLERLSFFPNMPTIAEQGFPGLEASTWLAVLLPAHTPADKVERLSQALAKVVKRPEMEQKFLSVGTIPRSSTAAEFAAFLKSEDARWSKVVAASGIKAD